MKYPFLAMAVAAMVAALPAARAQDNYVSLGAVYTDDDEARIVDDAVGGGQIAIGRYLSDYVAVEALIGPSNLSGKGGDDLSLTEFGVNWRFVPARDRLVSPYLTVGVSLLEVDSKLFEDKSAGALSAGLGFDINFSDSPFAVRLEHRFRRSDDREKEVTDTLTTLGFTYAFGTAEPLPAPAPEAEADSDGDGVRDSLDQCPDTPAGYRVGARGCPLDSDGDGVADALDECPNTVQGAAVDARGCEMDDDSDGVVNRLDQCPGTTAGVRVDIRGCEIREVIELPGVNFETNSDRLLPGADAVLRDAAATLRRYPDLVVEVAGHTDSQGSAEYNEGLSERRALTVRDFLINAGVNAGNLSARGYGEAQPIADNTTADGRARNRRVELRIVGE